MKAVCIIGSARSDGSTAYLIDKLAEGFAAGGGDVHKYALCEMDIRYCRGCKKCYIDGNCVIHDDVVSIVMDILSADLVVIAAPSYWGDVPGQLKTFFDRNTPFGDTNSNRNLIADKKIQGVGIAVRAGRTDRENTVILDFIDHYYGHLGINQIRRFSVCETDSLSDLLDKHQDIISEVYAFGKDFAERAKRE